MEEVIGKPKKIPRRASRGQALGPAPTSFLLRKTFPAGESSVRRPLHRVRFCDRATLALDRNKSVLDVGCGGSPLTMAITPLDLECPRQSRSSRGSVGGPWAPCTESEAARVIPTADSYALDMFRFARPE